MPGPSAGTPSAGAPSTRARPGPGRLLVVCALGVERLALRRGWPPGHRPSAGSPTALLRTGMGPRSAQAAVARALRAEDPAEAHAEAGAEAGGRAGEPSAGGGGRVPGRNASRAGPLRRRSGTRSGSSHRAGGGVRFGDAVRPWTTSRAGHWPARPSLGGPADPGPGGRASAVPAAVVVTGFCAGLVPGMRPGDLVVADETWDPDGRTRCGGFERLVEALTRAGVGGPRQSAHPARGPRVYTGPLVGTDHLVRGRERGRLRNAGAVAADMESAAVLRTARAHGVRQLAAVRVVVDAPGHELVRFRTLMGGVSAFRALSAVCPVLQEWHRP